MEGRHDGTAVIRCRNCWEPVEACAGEHGDWMHTATRREACAGGATHADAEGYGDVIRREGQGRGRR